MLRKVTLKNFKLHASTELDLRPITVFIGPNNSGKSSVFHALLALRQALHREMGADHFLDPHTRMDTSATEPYLYPPRTGWQVVELGDFKDVLRIGATDVLYISVAGHLPEGPQSRLGPVEIDLAVGVADNRLASNSGAMRVGGRGEARWNWLRPNSTGPPGQLAWGNAAIEVVAAPNFGLVAASVTYPPGIGQEQFVQGSAAAQEVSSAPRRLLGSVRPVYPLRGFEEWGFPLPDEAPGDLAFSTLPDRAIALSSTLAYNRDIEEKLSQWLEGLAGIGIKFELVRGKRVTVRTVPAKGPRSTTLFANEGTGTNQLPFILVPIGMAQAGETLLVSEPEAHLHPQLQAEIARLLLKFSTDRSLQFLIETHSEHVLHALLHAVAKRELARDELAIYYFENDAGTAKVTRLAIDENGRVAGGLPGFFDQSLEELSEYLEALKKA